MLAALRLVTAVLLIGAGCGGSGGGSSDASASLDLSRGSHTCGSALCTSDQLCIVLTYGIAMPDASDIESAECRSIPTDCLSNPTCDCYRTTGYMAAVCQPNGVEGTCIDGQTGTDGADILCGGI